METRPRTKFLAAIASSLLLTLPLVAESEGIEVDGSTPTTLDQAPNGVPVVNIANPNPQGLSHNRYSRFNVAPQGAILNNSRESVTQTQLGGLIYGNPQLQNNAKVILNEVSGAQASQLEGYTEVAGPAADIVIANPNGISINGAGFINAPRVTLTTGKPEIDSEGRLGGYRVEQGQISINGQGLDASRQDSLSLYSETLKLNARLHANDAAIVLGSNRIAADGRVQVLQRNGQVTGVALDSSAVGGMYAGKIRIVGTAQGFGVNLPPEVVASEGDIDISANGDLKVDQLAATGRIDMHSATTLQLDGKIQSAADTRITATRLETATGSRLTADGQLSIESDQLEHRGEMSSRGDLSLRAKALDNGGQALSGQSLEIEADRLSNTGQLHANGDMRLRVGELENPGRVSATGHLGIEATLVENSGSLQAADINLSGTDINNRGDLTATQITLKTQTATNEGRMSAGETLGLQSSDRLTNLGNLQAGERLEINSGLVEQSEQGRLLSGGEMAVQASDRLNNRGRLQSGGNLTLDTPRLDNRGLIASSQALSVDATTVSQQSGAGGQRAQMLGSEIQVNAENLGNLDADLLARDHLDIRVSTALENDSGGLIQSAAGLNLQAATVENSGRLLGQDLELQLGRLINPGKLQASGWLDLLADGLDNSGALSADAGMSIQVYGVLRNSAIMQSLGAIDLTAEMLNNRQGRIRSGNDLVIDTRQQLDNQNGWIQSARNGRIESGLLDTRSGVIETVGSLRLVLGGALLEQASLRSGQDLELILPRLEYSPTTELTANGLLAVRAAQGIDLQAGLSTPGSLYLETAETLDNAHELVAQGNLELRLGSLVNTGEIASGGNGLIRLAGNLANNGRIISQQDQVIGAETLDNNGLIAANADLEINTTSLDNRMTLFSGADMRLLVSDRLYNHPHANILANHNLLLAADNAGGRTGGITNELANIQTLSGDIVIHAGQYANLGQATLDYDTYWYDLGTQQRYANWDPSKGVLNLGYRSRIRSAQSDAIGYWVKEIQKRISEQAPYLSVPIGYSRGLPYVRFLAVVEKVENHTITSPSWLNSGAGLELHVGEALNNNSVVSAVEGILFQIDKAYTNVASAVDISATNYEYYALGVSTSHRTTSHPRGGYRIDSREPKHHRYIPITSTLTITADTVTQAGGGISGQIGGRLVSNGTGVDLLGVLQGSANAPAPVQAPDLQIDTAAPVAIQVRAEPGFTGEAPGLSQLGTLDPGTPPAAPPLELPLPQGDNGLFVLAPDPESNYLIETNPAFTEFGNFISSAYLLEHVDFSPIAELKRVGDAFYENQLIRASIFQQTGTRYLNADIRSDREQYRYLMDNALEAARDLNLTPGVALSKEQINQLNRDIVWMEARQVAGQTVLVPRVYLAHDRIRVRGGQILAGEGIDLQVASLDNSGLLSAGGDFRLSASDSLLNQGGQILSGGQLSLVSQNDLENISGLIQAQAVELESLSGSVINRRMQEESAFDNGAVQRSQTLSGDAGRLQAEGEIRIQAAETFTNQASNLNAGSISVEAGRIDIAALHDNSDFHAQSGKDFITERDRGHIASQLQAGAIQLHSSGDTRISGSQLTATDTLAVRAGSLSIEAVENSHYRESYNHSKGWLGEESTHIRTFMAQSQGSELTADRILLETTRGDLNIEGGQLQGGSDLALTSAGSIDIHEGRDRSLNEYQHQESGWFTGGSLYSASEDLSGRTTDTASASKLSAANIRIQAQDRLELQGVDIQAEQRLSASASDIDIRNAQNTEIAYDSHKSLSIGLGDIAGLLANPGEVIRNDHGKLSLTIARADYQSADQQRQQTTAAASHIQAGSLELDARAGQGGGNIIIQGSDLDIQGQARLSADGDIALLDATETLDQTHRQSQGSATLDLTLKNEYQQIAPAREAVQQAERDLRHAREALNDYHDQLAQQRQRLEQLRQDLAAGKPGVEAADVAHLEQRVAELAADEKYYRANIALASSTLISKSDALVAQLAKAAASSGTYGFNLGLELNLDLEHQRGQSHEQHSRGSRLSAADIQLNSGATTRLIGSDLLATDRIRIDAQDLDIQAGRNHSQNSTRSEHHNASLGYDLYGGNSAEQLASATPGSASANLGYDRNNHESEATHHRNSQLQAADIRLDIRGDTRIHGAAIHGRDRLSLNTQNLDLASVEDIERELGTTRGIDAGGSLGGGIGSGGLDQGRSHSRNQQTLLTSLSGGQVSIQVKDHSRITGATVIAVDEHGRDNGQLTFHSRSLEAGSLIDSEQHNDRSLGLGLGSTVRLDSHNSQGDRLGKTLATLG